MNLTTLEDELRGEVLFYQSLLKGMRKGLGDTNSPAPSCLSNCASEIQLLPYRQKDGDLTSEEAWNHKTLVEYHLQKYLKSLQNGNGEELKKNSDICGQVLPNLRYIVESLR